MADPNITPEQRATFPARLMRLRSMQDLTKDRHKFFVLEYLVDFNAARAARAVGYKDSVTSSRQQGMKLLKREDVQLALAECRRRAAAQLEVTVESVVENLSQTVTEARDAGQFGAAISGIRLVGDYLGMFGTADRRQPDGIDGASRIEEADYQEVDDNRSDAQVLADFLADVRMLATQRDALQMTVEDFLDDAEEVAQQALPQALPQEIEA